MYLAPVTLSQMYFWLNLPSLTTNFSVTWCRICPYCSAICALIKSFNALFSHLYVFKHHFFGWFVSLKCMHSRQKSLDVCQEFLKIWEQQRRHPLNKQWPLTGEVSMTQQFHFKTDLKEQTYHQEELVQTTNSLWVYGFWVLCERFSSLSPACMRLIIVAKNKK